MRGLSGKVSAKIKRVFGISVERAHFYTTIGRELLPIDRATHFAAWGVREGMFCSDWTGDMFTYCMVYLDARGYRSFNGHKRAAETSRLKEPPARH
jgi:hypothetical protein